MRRVRALVEVGGLRRFGNCVIAVLVDGESNPTMACHFTCLPARRRRLATLHLIVFVLSIASSRAAADPLVPANASFSGASNVDLLTHNFGVVRQGAPAAVFDFAINNLSALSGTTANLSLVATDSLGDSTSIALVHPPISGLPAGQQTNLQLQLSTATPGTLAVSYKLKFASDGLPGEELQDLALAAFATVLQAGDYNADGEVNLDDYLEWKTTFGSITQLQADGNFNGQVDAADFTVWRDNFVGESETGGGAIAGGAVPEPGSLSLVLGVFLGTAGSAPITRRSRRPLG